MNVLIADKFEAEGVAGLKTLGCEVAAKAGLTLGHAGGDRGDPGVGADRALDEGAGDGDPGSPGLRLIIRAGAGVDSIDVKRPAPRGSRSVTARG